MRDGMIVYREQSHEVGRVGYRLSWSMEDFPNETLKTHMIVRYGMTAFNLWSGREISTVLMPISFSVPASTTEDDIRKMVFLRIAKDHPQLIEYIC